MLLLSYHFCDGSDFAEDQAIEEAAQVMEKHQIRRLIVLNRDKRLVGIVSLGDLATHRQGKKAAGEALTEISKAA